MSVTVRWENTERTLVLWTFPDRWTWDDYFEARVVSDQMLRSVPHRVDLIADLTHSSVLPQSAFVTYSRSLRNAPGNTGRIVVVGASILVKLMIETFSRITPHDVPGANFRLALTVDEAKAALRTQSVTNSPKA